MEPIVQDQPKKAQIGRPRRLRAVDLDQIHHQLLVVLKREILRLMDESFKNKLSEDSSKSLINYLKIIKDLGKPKNQELNSQAPTELEDFSDLSDDELKKLASKPQHGDKNG